MSVGGLRPYNWFKYLKEFGVEPVVVTRQWQNHYGDERDYIAAGWSDQVEIEETREGTIIRSPYKPNLSNRLLLKYGSERFKLIRKSITAFYEIVQFLLPVGPKASVYHAARAYLRTHQVDGIIATADPFVLFSYAAKLSREFDTPWIADYRDPWSLNEGRGNNKLSLAWHKFLEKKIVRSASMVTTVSAFVQFKIDSVVPNKSYTLLPNGFDPDIIDSLKDVTQDGNELAISFVGSIYPWHPLHSFLRQAEEFVHNRKNPRIVFKFYGTNMNDELIELVQKEFPSLAPYLFVYPKISNAELLHNLAKDHVMLLFNYYSFMGTKIFDYLGIRRKMILCYMNDSEANELKEKYYTTKENDHFSGSLQADLIQETESGILVENASHLMEVLDALYTEFETTGEIACPSKDIAQFSRKIQVEKLAKLIHQLP